MVRGDEARLHQVEGMHCPHCDFEIEKTFLRCPSCLRRLKSSRSFTSQTTTRP